MSICHGGSDGVRCKCVPGSPVYWLCPSHGTMPGRPKKVNALFPPERDKECVDHMMSWSGRVPCTGVLRCLMCGTRQEDLDKGVTHAP